MFLRKLFIFKNNEYISYYEKINLENNYYNFFFLIKYFAFIIFIFILFYFKFIYININKKINIEIDNYLRISLFEKNINFSNNSYDINAITFFHPESIYINKLNDKNKFAQLYHYLNNKNLSKNKNENILEIIRKQVGLAKSHGLYGFAIYYDLDYNKKTNKVLNALIDKEINFPFFLIWKNDNIELKNNLNNNLLHLEKLYKILLDKLIKNIKEYMIKEIYIKINDLPVLSINKPSIIPNLKQFLYILREKARAKIGKIFIFTPLRNLNESSEYSILFDSAYDLSKIKLFEGKNFIPKNLYYAGILYKNIIFQTPKIKNNFSIYRTSILEPNIYSEKNKLKDYSPEKFYLLNKLLFEWTKINYNTNNRIIFIYSWNNYLEGNYLEPDQKYGYSSINSFSKALFYLPYKDNNYSLISLNTSCYVAIQAHIFYEDLISEIIIKTNNIPIKFDLYITIIEYKNRNKIEEYVRCNSKANKFEIKIVENKGRDVLPLIIQLKNKIKLSKLFVY